MSERRTRVEQSIRLICDALWSLMEKKAFSEISVSEVCQTATVSRNTFYRRFGVWKMSLTIILRERRVIF